MAPKHIFVLTTTIFELEVIEEPQSPNFVEGSWLKGNQSWIFIGGTDAVDEAEASILWQPELKSQLTAKDPDTVKHWSRRGRGR